MVRLSNLSDDDYQLTGSEHDHDHHPGEVPLQVVDEEATVSAIDTELVGVSSIIPLCRGVTYYVAACPSPPRTSPLHFHSPA